ncbi:hypothetical protein WLX37_15890, partial [Bordetella bronchiseptica]
MSAARLAPRLIALTVAALAAPGAREMGVSRVLAGGLLGGVGGPNLASFTKELFVTPFLGAYLALAV